MPDLQSFRLRRIRISGHPVLKEVDVVLCDDKNQADTLYTTGIIGPNGTGKSHLMSAIATASRFFDPITPKKTTWSLSRPSKKSWSAWTMPVTAPHPQISSRSSSSPAIRSLKPCKPPVQFWKNRPVLKIHSSKNDPRRNLAFQVPGSDFLH